MQPSRTDVICGTENFGGTTTDVIWITRIRRVLIRNLRPLSCTCITFDLGQLISEGKAAAVARADAWRKEHSYAFLTDAFLTIKYFVTLVFWQGVAFGGNVSACNHGLLTTLLFCRRGLCKSILLTRRSGRCSAWATSAVPCKHKRGQWILSA